MKVANGRTQSKALAGSSPDVPRSKKAIYEEFLTKFISNSDETAINKTYEHCGLNKATLRF